MSHIRAFFVRAYIQQCRPKPKYNKFDNTDNYNFKGKAKTALCTDTTKAGDSIWVMCQHK